MSSEVVPITKALQHRWRNKVPNEYKGNLDERLRWMWNQKFGTIQTIFNEGTDEEDRMAATMFLQAILETDLDTIETIFRRICYALIAAAGIISLPALDGIIR